MLHSSIRLQFSRTKIHFDIFPFIFFVYQRNFFLSIKVNKIKINKSLNRTVSHNV